MKNREQSSENSCIRSVYVRRKIQELVIKICHKPKKFGKHCSFVTSTNDFLKTHANFHLIGQSNLNWCHQKADKDKFLWNYNSDKNTKFRFILVISFYYQSQWIFVSTLIPKLIKPDFHPLLAPLKLIIEVSWNIRTLWLTFHSIIDGDNKSKDSLIDLYCIIEINMSINYIQHPSSLNALQFLPSFLLLRHFHNSQN